MPSYVLLLGSDSTDVIVLALRSLTTLFEEAERKKEKESVALLSELWECSGLDVLSRL